MKIKSLLTAAAVLALMGATSAFAAPIVFDFSPGPPQNVGPSEVYTAGGYSITAYGFFTTTGIATDLYQKYTLGNSSETGLGIARDNDHEIPGQYFVQLDVQNLINAGFTQMTLKLGSLQAGEQAKVYGDTSLGSFGGTLLSTLTGLPVEQWVTVNLTTRYFDITGAGTGGGDPVLESLTINTVPDGGSMVLMLGASLLGIAAVRKFRASHSFKGIA